MSPFEFSSIFASIILGLGLTHLFTGAVKQIYRHQLSFMQAAYAVLALLLITLQWWSLLAWSGEPNWTLVQFLVLVLWSLSMLAFCVAIFPPDELGGEDFEVHLRVVGLTLFSMCMLDIVQTGLHGPLFTPIFYLPVILHYAALSLLAALTSNRRVRLLVAVWLPAFTFAYGFIWSSVALG